MSMAEFTGQTYGQAGQQRASQQAVRPGPPPTEGGMGGPGPLPLTRPSERPNEPVTAGAMLGEGPGPEALEAGGIAPGSREDSLLRLRAIVSRYPSPALLQLLYDFERSQ
jgi:hypothetical protein